MGDPDIGLQNMNFKMTNEYAQQINYKMNNFNSNKKSIKKNYRPNLQLKNIITGFKNSVDGLSSKLDIAEKISGLGY